MIKKLTLILMAALVLSPAAYAQTESAAPANDVSAQQADDAADKQEKILLLIKHYNPAVLEKAQTQPIYQKALEDFVLIYQQQSSQLPIWELAAAIRNFENSVELTQLSHIYSQQWLLAGMSGQDRQQVRAQFRPRVQTVMNRVWAVTVQARTEQVRQLKKQRKTIKKDDSLPVGEEEKQLLANKTQLENAKQELKKLKKHSDTYIQSITDQYLTAWENAVQEQMAH